MQFETNATLLMDLLTSSIKIHFNCKGWCEKLVICCNSFKVKSKFSKKKNATEVTYFWRRTVARGLVASAYNPFDIEGSFLLPTGGYQSLASLGDSLRECVAIRQCRAPARRRGPS